MERERDTWGALCVRRDVCKEVPTRLIGPPFFISVDLHFCIYVWLSFCLSVSLSICLYLSICLPVYCSIKREIERNGFSNPERTQRSSLLPKGSSRIVIPRERVRVRMRMPMNEKERKNTPVSRPKCYGYMILISMLFSRHLYANVLSMFT